MSCWHIFRETNLWTALVSTNVYFSNSFVRRHFKRIRKSLVKPLKIFTSFIFHNFIHSKQNETKRKNQILLPVLRIVWFYLFRLLLSFLPKISVDGGRNLKGKMVTGTSLKHVKQKATRNTPAKLCISIAHIFAKHFFFGKNNKFTRQNAKFSELVAMVCKYPYPTSKADYMLYFGRLEL